VRVFDWEQPANTDFLLVSQFSLTGALYTCRPDLVGFVNGLGYLRTVKKTWIPLLLLAWALGARAGEASKYAEQVAPLIDPAKLATLPSVARIRASRNTWRNWPKPSRRALRSATSWFKRLRS